MPFSNNEFISFALSRGKPPTFTQANDTNGRPGSLRIPSRLRNVFLYVENVGYLAHPLDLDLNIPTSQITEYPELEDLSFNVRGGYFVDTENWMLDGLRPGERIEGRFEV